MSSEREIFKLQRLLRRGVLGALLLACPIVISLGSLFGQDASPGASPAANPTQASIPSGKPDNPPQEKKSEDPNPAQAAAEKTKDMTLQAAEETRKLGEQTLLKMRDWEYGWITGPYVVRTKGLAPLTADQRWNVYLEQTLTTPGSYLKRMFVAGIDQLRESPLQWGDGWGPYGMRFASREGQFITANSVAALGNAALRYEPLYDECRCSGFRRRSGHAILRNFLTYDQSERNLRPQWALYGGAFAGGVISSAWKPRPRNALADGGYAVLGQAGWGALLNFVTEFADDINRKLGARHRPH